MPIDMCPARLDHTDFRIAKMMDGPQEEIFRWNEVGIKDRHELTLRRFQSFRKRTSLEAFTIMTVMVSNRMTKRGVSLHQPTGYSHGFVSGIVQYLDIELFARVVEAGDCVQ